MDTLEGGDRVAFGMRDTLLIQCKEVIEILREELAEERKTREKAQESVLESKHQIDHLETQNRLLEDRIAELTKQLQSLQNLNFLESKKRIILEARISELTAALQLSETKNKNLLTALESSQIQLQDVMKRLGSAETEVTKDLQMRYRQVKASEQELMNRLEAALRENEGLNKGGRKENDVMERKEWAEIGEIRTEEKPNPHFLSSPNSVISPVAGSNEASFHFETELEKQKQEHEELLNRLHSLVHGFKTTS